ncbi:hypothetical protein [uncultured Pseudoflavonifractor sp.]|uniref:hypothetical protein n=1 Tax=uncultured Pseudoflavonifractor sp. TaxID=1221379 RepID=UPI0025E42933|nr:hypothetical protein [uncultured Pseudoflavonifractor sp.]
MLENSSAVLTGGAWDIGRAVKAGFITGADICDDGAPRQMFCRNGFGRTMQVGGRL